jgi:hypothetical protein
VWFWLAITFAAAIQVPPVLLIPWTMHSFPRFAFLGMGGMDFAIVFGFIRLFEKVMQPGAPGSRL